MWYANEKSANPIEDVNKQLLQIKGSQPNFKHQFQMTILEFTLLLMLLVLR